MRLVLATILTAAVVTPLAVTSASAQYFYPTATSSYWWQGQPATTETRTVTVNRMRRPYATGAYAYAPYASGAYAYGYAPRVMERHSLSFANDVYVNGVYVGSDPDPRIRESLRREAITESSSR